MKYDKTFMANGLSAYGEQPVDKVKTRCDKMESMGSGNEDVLKETAGAGPIPEKTAEKDSAKHDSYLGLVEIGNKQKFVASDTFFQISSLILRER